MDFLLRPIQSLLKIENETDVSHAIIRSATLNAIPQLLVWGGLYWHFGLREAALVLLVWAPVTLLFAVVYSRRPGSVALLLPWQFAGVVAINTAATFFLGGLVQSYGQFLWAFLVPMGVLVVYGPRQAFYWFLAYVVILFALARLSTPVSPPLPAVVGQFMTALNISLTGLFIFLGMCFFIAKKNQFYELLRQEEKKSENLLLNILPAEIADVLKNRQGTIAAYYERTSILFLDLVGFTPLVEKLGPDATVEMLNTLFSEFDDLVDRYRLEKIKTIGDCYMVAAGLPRPRDDHAAALVALGLELGRFTHEYAEECGQPITFRAGVHSGPVTAGVIGKRKFAFDVWGDTVNIASRMESHGVPGRVQISDETYRLISGRFECEPRGEIDIKGKGAMQTWIVSAGD